MSANFRLASISLDCPDPPGLAAFYARLLGVEIDFKSDNFAAIRYGGMWLSMQRVEKYRSPIWPDGDVPQQIHLDMAVDDLDAAESEALSVGATKAMVQPQPDRWRVMLDPAGHPFCLSTLIPDA